MGFRDFLRKGSGLDLVAEEKSGEGGDDRPSGVGVKQSQRNSGRVAGRADEKMLKQMELELSRAIEKLEEVRDKLRVRRGY